VGPRCEQYFGTYSAQVFFDWSTAPPSRPALQAAYTPGELDALFEHADEEVERIGTYGRNGW
jgi:hypothetical protein